VVRQVQLLLQADTQNPRFRSVGLAIEQPLPNFGMQGVKGGDFLSELLKKYDLCLAWRKAYIYRVRRERL